MSASITKSVRQLLLRIAVCIALASAPAWGESVIGVGTERVDVHDNVIYDPIFSRYAVRIRGGKGVVWSNALVGYGPTGIELTQDTPQTTGPIYIWKNSIDPETSQMVNAHGTMGTPEYYLSPPDEYVPHPYPHPLVVDSD